ncbi:MAG: DUF2934 domain-containing protein [Rhizomicrobium sp.]
MLKIGDYLIILAVGLVEVIITVALLRGDPIRTTLLFVTFIAVYGVFMTPFGWGRALVVWGYALAWFLVNDRVKLFAYRVFDPTAVPLLASVPDGSTTQIAKRAYKIYEREGRREGHAALDWLKAERELGNNELTR